MCPLRVFLAVLLLLVSVIVHFVRAMVVAQLFFFWEGAGLRGLSVQSYCSRDRRFRSV